MVACHEFVGESLGETALTADVLCMHALLCALKGNGVNILQPGCGYVMAT